MLPARGGGGGRPSATPALFLLSVGPSEGSFVLRIKSVKPSARRKWAQRQLAHEQQFTGKKRRGNGCCVRGNLHTQLVSCLRGSCEAGGFTVPGPSLEVITDNQMTIPAEGSGTDPERGVGTKACGLAWESEDLESRPDFPCTHR